MNYFEVMKLFRQNSELDLDLPDLELPVLTEIWNSLTNEKNFVLELGEDANISYFDNNTPQKHKRITLYDKEGEMSIPLSLPGTLPHSYNIAAYMQIKSQNFLFYPISRYNDKGLPKGIKIFLKVDDEDFKTIEWEEKLKLAQNKISNLEISINQQMHNRDLALRILIDTFDFDIKKATLLNILRQQKDDYALFDVFARNFDHRLPFYNNSTPLLYKIGHLISTGETYKETMVSFLEHLVVREVTWDSLRKSAFSFATELHNDATYFGKSSDYDTADQLFDISDFYCVVHNISKVTQKCMRDLSHKVSKKFGKKGDAYLKEITELKYEILKRA